MKRMQGENCPRKILWIHGWGMSPEIWRKEINDWFGDGRRQGDPMNKQQGPCPEHQFFSYAHCHTVDSFQSALRQTVRDLKPDAIVGWSMGGMLALEWLQSAELELPSHVVIAASTLCFVDGDRNAGWSRRIVKRMRDKIKLEPDAVLQQFAHSMLSEKEQSEGVSDVRLQKPTTDFSSEGLEAGLTYLIINDLRELWNTKLIPSLADRRIKLLWIHGSDDVICPNGAMPELTTGLEIAVLSGAGHVPFITQPGAFFGQLKGFLYDDRDR